MKIFWILIPAALHGFVLDNPAFDAASVKRSPQCILQNAIDPGIVALHGDPLNVILMEAFSVKADQIVGPSWLTSACFSIDATIPPNATTEQVPAMLRALLAERFKLVVHKESRPIEGYVLLLEKGGPKLKVSPPDSPASRSGSVTFGAGAVSQIKGAMTTSKLARLLSNNLKVPVEDLTNLSGKYEVDISWLRAQVPLESASTPSADDIADDVFSALRTAGLKLEKRRESVEMIVIDHIEQLPTAN